MMMIILNNNNNSATVPQCQSINVISACLVSPDRLQDGQREDGDAADAADDIKYAEQTDQVQE